MGNFSPHSSIAGSKRSKKSKRCIHTLADRGSVQWQAICAAKSYFVGLCFRAGFFFLSVSDAAVYPPLEDAIALANIEFKVKLQVDNGLMEVVGFKYSS